MTPDLPLTGPPSDANITINDLNITLRDFAAWRLKNWASYLRRQGKGDERASRAGAKDARM